MLERLQDLVLTSIEDNYLSAESDFSPGSDLETPLALAKNAFESCLRERENDDDKSVFEVWKREIEDSIGGFHLGETYWRLSEFNADEKIVKILKFSGESALFNVDSPSDGKIRFSLNPPELPLDEEALKGLLMESSCELQRLDHLRRQGEKEKEHLKIDSREKEARVVENKNFDNRQFPLPARLFSNTTTGGNPDSKVVVESSASSRKKRQLTESIQSLVPKSLNSDNEDEFFCKKISPYIDDLIQILRFIKNSTLKDDYEFKSVSFEDLKNLTDAAIASVEGSWIDLGAILTNVFDDDDRVWSDFLYEIDSRVLDVMFYMNSEFNGKRRKIALDNLLSSKIFFEFDGFLGPKFRTMRRNFEESTYGSFDALNKYCN